MRVVHDVGAAGLASLLARTGGQEHNAWVERVEGLAVSFTATDPAHQWTWKSVGTAIGRASPGRVDA